MNQCFTMQYHFCIKCVLVFNLVFFASVPAKAQVIPDRSLGGKNSAVIPNQTINGTPSDLISGGSIRGENLFHSFQDFNIAVGHGVYFANPSGIANIFSRVTGANPSNILGTLGVQGKANLFFLNPNGMLFGSNARLDLNGSFVATTARSFNWPNGIQFSAENPKDAPPLLTVSVPIGLHFTGNPGSIEVQGVGHNLTEAAQSVGLSGANPILGAGYSTTGLRVQPGKAIALIGGNISFNGGIVTAPAGQVEVGSVSFGDVKIDSSFKLNYSLARTFQNIQLTNFSLLDASGLGSGEINIQGNQFTLSGSSFVLLQSQGATSAGRIDVNAAQSLTITGNTSEATLGIPSYRIKVRSGIVSQTPGGQGANINISTKDLLLQFAGGVASYATLSGVGGNVLINASNSIRFVGFSPIDPINNLNFIGASSAGSGTSGEVKVLTRNLFIQDGGGIGTTSYGTGDSGNVTVDASEKIQISGINPVSLLPSVISSVAFALGKAGNININTQQLKILDGGGVNSTTEGEGSAGNITIKASDFVNVRGTVSGSITGFAYPAFISSSGSSIDPLVAVLLGIPSAPKGNSGNVNISTNRLSVTDGAQVTVKNEGMGRSGTLIVNAPSIFLDNKGSITASTASGEGGNITVSARDLRLQRGSYIDASALSGTRQGGNVTFNTGTLVMLDSSSIKANAFGGPGGNIAINAQGFFRSPDSVISASSRFGVSGTVRINTLDVSRNLELAALPAIPVDYTKLIPPGCSANVGPRASKFVVTGSGGLPPSPSDFLGGKTALEDWGTGASSASTLPTSDRADRADIENAIPSTQYEYHGGPLIEAQGWVTNSKGEVVLVANAPTYTPDVPWLKSPSCHAQ